MNYEYKCNCGKTKEVFHSMKVTPKVQCDCGKSMKRKITGGVGWFFDRSNDTIQELVRANK